MKKLIITSIIALTTTCGFASDYYIPQETTSEVFTRQQVQVTNDCYGSVCNKRVAMPSYKMAPVTVHTGRTVTVKDHYDVYQPRVVYDKVDSYTTTKTCTYCD